MNFVERLEQVAREQNPGPPIAVGHPYTGILGHLEGRKGFRPLRTAGARRQLDALVRDDERFRTLRREGRLPRRIRDRLLEVGRELAAFHRDEMGAITTWNGVLNARTGGKFADYMGTKASQTTVANAWSGFARSTGNPGAVTFGNIPGGSALDHTNAGAWPLIKQTVDSLYLTNFGVNHATGTNVVMLADFLVGAGNISSTIATSQTVNTAALTRYTDGVGVQGIQEVTTAQGATAQNLTWTYTNQAGTGSRSTGAQAMTASAITFRLQPATLGAQIPLQSGDYGIRSVESVIYSAGNTAGACVLWLYKPLLIVPTLATTSFVERSVPAMIGGIIPLVNEGAGAGSDHGCLSFLVLPSTTSTGVQTYFLQTAWG